MGIVKKFFEKIESGPCFLEKIVEEEIDVNARPTIIQKKIDQIVTKVENRIENKRGEKKK